MIAIAMVTVFSIAMTIVRTTSIKRSLDAVDAQSKILTLMAMDIWTASMNATLMHGSSNVVTVDASFSKLILITIAFQIAWIHALMIQ